MPNSKQALSATLEQLQIQARRILSRRHRRHPVRDGKSSSKAVNITEENKPAATKEEPAPDADKETPLRPQKTWRDEDAPERQLFPGAQKSWQEGSG